jgi:short-subunit dehydrogenase
MTQTVILTGVSSGLGLALGTQLLDADHHVVGVSRRESTDPTWTAAVAAGNATHILGDVADAQTVTAAFSAAAQIGNLTTVINCAGAGVFCPAGEATPQLIDAALRANLVGLILFSNAAFAAMKSAGGTIVNIMSTSAHTPRVEETLYCAAKFGARGYTESLRLEAKQTPVDIVAVYPGGMASNFWRDAVGTSRDGAGFMDPADVAKTILAALAAPAGSYTSDITINRK